MVYGVIFICIGCLGYYFSDSIIFSIYFADSTVLIAAIEKKNSLHYFRSTTVSYNGVKYGKKLATILYNKILQEF